ncbi:MAG: class I SAM-dependent methyltransferase [Opitutales bacterium]
MYQSITAAVHRRLAAHLRPGDWALDATAGNGHDTLALARLLGPTGRVYAIDVQPEAIAATKARLAREDSPTAPAILLRGDHADLADLLPPETRGRLRAVVFNLGFLPGADKSLTTRAVTTLAALEGALDWLADDGAVAVTCYPGHAEGAGEAAAVEAWALRRASQPAWQLDTARNPGTRRPGPFLLWLARV